MALCSPTQLNLNSFLDKDYEMVWMRADYFDRRRPDLESFAAYFRGDTSVVAFDNLGKNARLIVPCPQDAPEYYKNILSFLKNVSNE